MKNLIINNWLKTYLIGPMENVAKKDGGRGWRDNITLEIMNRVDENNNPIYIFNPCKEEQNKTGMVQEVLHKKIQGWLASGNNDMIKENGSLIWQGKTYIETDENGKARLIKILGDVDYVRNSNFLICRMEKGDHPCGTFGEACIAVEHNIPIYVIQTMARTEYSGSFVQFVFTSGGGFFNSQTELMEYIDKKYKLKIRKGINNE